jgi:hypothetical protein
MPSSAVPNTDLPSPDPPDTETGPGPDVARGTADPAAAGAAGDPESGPWAASATLLRCDGCGARAVIDQDEHRYGGLVRSFLGQHSGCGNAVQITRIHPEDD